MIINLTQHEATPAQLDAGVVDVPDRERLSALLTVKIRGQDGFAAMSPRVAQDFLRGRAWAIIEEFVLPMVAKATREYFAAAYPKALTWEYADVLNARYLPRVQCMVGGFGPLMDTLVPMLRESGAEPLHALSDRVSVEEIQPDGSVVKKQVFRHLGFYPAE